MARTIVKRTTKGSELTWQEIDNNFDQLDTDLATAEDSVATLQTDVVAKAPLTDAALLGVPTSPTAIQGTDTQQLATTEFVNAAVLAGGAGSHDHNTDYFQKTEFIATSAGAADAAKPVVLDGNGEINGTMINLTYSDVGAAALVHDHDSDYFTKAEFIAGSAGAGDAGKPVKLDGAGKFDYSMIPNHASEHATAGGDPITAVSIGAEVADVAIQNHLVNTSNPHSTTAAHVGNDTAQWNANQLQGFDVHTTTPTDGQVLEYNGTSSRWQPATGAGGGGDSYTTYKAWDGGLEYCEVTSDVGDVTFAWNSGTKTGTFTNTSAGKIFSARIRISNTDGNPIHIIHQSGNAAVATYKFPNIHIYNESTGTMDTASAIRSGSSGTNYDRVTIVGMASPVYIQIKMADLT